MTGSPTATERTAIRTGYAALHTAKSPNSEIVEQIVFALGSAGMLQSPETGAEMERLRLRVDEVERRYIFDTATLKQRIAELEAAADESRPVDEDPIAYELTPVAEAPHERPCRWPSSPDCVCPNAPDVPASAEEWCTGCNTDHDPDECGYRPNVEAVSCG